MWELELESKGVEDLTGGISELELVGVLVELEDLEDLGNDIEVTGGLGGSLELDGFLLIDGVVLTEEEVGPFLEVLNDLGVLLLERWLLSGVGEWAVTVKLTLWGVLIGGEKSPG